MTRHRYDSATPEAPSIASLPVTAQLLLACAHARLGERESARVRELAAGQIDWDCLLELAGQHAVVALLYQSLRAAAADVAPATVIEQLRAAFHASTQHSLMQTGELLRLAHTLAEAQIPMIALKGPTLATMAYGSLALRSSVDLDILVRKADLERAMALLRSQGYQQLEQLGEAQVDAYIEAQHHFSFVRESLLVELHYELGERYFEVQIDTDQLWEHAAPVALAGHTVSALSYTDQLTTLCIHGLRHCWERLAWVCDIAELLRQERELDWPALLAEQQARGTERLLLLGVYLAHRLLAAPLPAVNRCFGSRSCQQVKSGAG
ncbi:MAG: nucleotidyltransferase family protein [Chloroflexales bacterium]|nr:nucleotidyltransferase family protein [Chloroflexales bacterium]